MQIIVAVDKSLVRKGCQKRKILCIRSDIFRKLWIKMKN